MNAKRKLASIKKDIARSRKTLNELRKAREEAAAPIARQTGTDPLLKARGLKPKKYKLVAQGDSWFDYLPGRDLVDWLRHKHGHSITNLATGGSTLNEVVYGPVPRNLFGVPRSSAVDRIAELVDTLRREQPRGLLLCGGGNDVAGPEFFQLVNNARSGLANPNAQVVEGVLNETFRKAYEDLIETCLEAADEVYEGLTIFTHGYDYPWPDGRGVSIFNLVGPWFDPTFEAKSYPYANNAQQLARRFAIVKVFIDAFNDMLADLEAKYADRVFHANLRGTLKTRDEWANELHPKNAGFEKLADQLNCTLHQRLG